MSGVARLFWKAGCVIFGAAALAWAAPRPVRFQTSDGWTLAAFYRPPRKGLDVAVLVHGLGSGKTEWDSFAEKLEARGIGSLALDLRGHGESRLGPRGSEDVSVRDVQAAMTYLRGRGIPASRIGLAGASIGANLASQAAEQTPVPWLVLLSPGLDYRGVRPATRPKTGRVLLAASPGDAYAYQSVQVLGPALKGSAALQAAGGHGVQMFADKAFLARLLDWMSKH